MRFYQRANFLEKYIFYILIFLIPLQTRRIFYFWGESFNEWMSVSLHWTDVLIFALFIFWFLRFVKKCGRPTPQNMDLAGYFLIAFIGWAGISMFFSDDILLGFYSWVKLLEMVFIFIYVREFVKNKGMNEIINIFWIFVLSAFFQAGLAITQFLNQGSLGLAIFHESPIGISKDGVAKINFNNFQLIRAYGIFPHPNILGAFLGLSIFFSYWLWFQGNFGKIIKYILLFIISFLFAGLFFTFSRSVIAITIIISIFFFGFIWFSTYDFYKKKKAQELALIIFLFVVALILLFQPLLFERFNIDFGEQAVNLRTFYNKAAIDFIGEFPVFGVGVGNFVSKLITVNYELKNWMYQPAHNLYLLMASEIGVVGLALFLIFVGLLIKTICRGYSPPYWKLFVVCCLLFVVFLGFFDHYFWTLQQGMLMMWIILGIATR